MATSPIPVTLHSGFRGWVVIVVNSSLVQKTFLDVRDASNNPITSATFEGSGIRVHAKNVFDNREYWSFGPFNFTATIHVKVTTTQGGSVVDSKMVGPLSVEKKPELPDFPMQFYQSTVASEDGHDADHNDCTVSILQYK